VREPGAFHERVLVVGFEKRKGGLAGPAEHVNRGVNEELKRTMVRRYSREAED